MVVRFVVWLDIRKAFNAIHRSLYVLHLYEDFSVISYAIFSNTTAVTETGI